MDKMTYAEFLLTLNLARKRYPAAVAERAEEEAEYAAQGYRPHYCVHGTNLWTDYDNICGGCEDGVTLRQMVVEGAWRTAKTMSERVDLVNEARRLGMPGLDSKAAYAWAFDAFKELA